MSAVDVATLAVADATDADMATLIIVGSRETRVVHRDRTFAASLYAARGRQGERMIEPVDRVLHRFDGSRFGAGGRRSMITPISKARAAAILP